MMAFSDNAKAVIALTTRLGDPSRPSLSPTRWHRFTTALTDAGLVPAQVFSRGFDPALPGVPDDLAESVRTLLGDAAAATVAAADLDNLGIWTLTIADGAYPLALSERLGRLTPPVIFGVGPQSLLAERGVAVVGAREVTEPGAAIGRDVARAVVDAGYTVVSGAARGVDQQALNAAHMSGGRVLGVLADSLSGRIRRPDILRALDAGRTTLMTQQSPSAGFSPASAMARNKLIYAMSRVTVVVASGLESGGTWNGAVEALKTGNGVVAVWRGEGEGPGNARLVELGAVPLHSADEVIACLDREPPSGPYQLSWRD